MTGWLPLPPRTAADDVYTGDPYTDQADDETWQPPCCCHRDGEYWPMYCSIPEHAEQGKREWEAAKR